MSIWQYIAERIRAQTGQPFAPHAPTGLGGGCINSAFKLSDGTRTWFVKTNNAARLEMSQAEAAGLDALAAGEAIKVPRALCTGTTEGLSFIVMEHLTMGHGRDSGWIKAGRQLAALHRNSATEFGWTRSNTIGATPQHTTAGGTTGLHSGASSAWVFNSSLRHPTAMGVDCNRWANSCWTAFPRSSTMPPSRPCCTATWANLGFTPQGEPVIYDPATYYGDREAELAMTELFGGFSADFYAAYREAWPMDAGYRIRRELYNLYHVLNHLNLFGGSYGSQAQAMMQRLLAEC